MIFQSYYQKFLTSPLAKRFFSGAFYSLCAGVCNSLGMVLLGILLAHMLGKDVYGRYGIIRSTMNMISAVSSFALGATATKYVAEYRESNKTKAGRVMTLSLVCTLILGGISAILCWIISPFLAERVLHDITLTVPLKIMALIIFFSLILGVLNGILIGFENFIYIFKISVVSALVLLVGSYIGSWKFGLQGSLIGLLLYFVSQVVLNIYYVAKTLKIQHISIVFDKISQEFYTLWKFSLPMTLSGLLVTPIVWFGNVTLVNSNPQGFEDMSGFNVIEQWKMALMFIPLIVGRIALPMLCNLSDNKNRSNYFKIIKISLLVNVGLSTIGALILSALGKIILAFYGAGYLEYLLPFIIMLWVGVVYIANSIVGQIIVSKNYAWWGVFFNFIWGICFCIFAKFLIDYCQLRLLGIAYTYLISYLILLFLQSAFCYFIKDEITSAS